MSEGRRSGKKSTEPTAASANQGSTPDLADQAQEVAGQVQEQAGQLVDRARGAATGQLSTQKDRAAGGLETAAGLLRGAGEQLRALDQPTVAQYVDGAAERTQQISQQLRTQDVGQLLETTERFARRQPGLFVGGALTLGFLATRFFKSSEPQPDRVETAGYPRDTTGGYAPYGGAAYGSEALGYGAATGADYATGLDDPLLDASLGDDSRAAAGYPPGSEER